MDLTTFSRAIPSPKDFLLTQTIFPTAEPREVEWRAKASGRYVNVVKYRAFNASVPFATREAWQTSREGALPPLGQKPVVSEQEQILLQASHGSDQDRLIELLHDDVERHVEAVRSRLELAAGDVLADGKFDLEQENGLTLEVDWNVPVENRPVACIPWSDPFSNPDRARTAVNSAARRHRGPGTGAGAGAHEPEGVFVPGGEQRLQGGVLRVGVPVDRADADPQQINMVRGN
ncbi:Phage major capsid protein E [Streptomyces sp. Ncost-T6T-1]|nr:Phage major capsid protein E [Streptomyces sp. Ncost-T6T-1]